MQKHPFPGKMEKNLLETVAKQGSLEIINGLLDKAGAIRKRPGLYFNQSLSAVGGIQAIYYWPAKEKIVVVAGGQVYAANNLAATLVQVSNYTAMLNPGNVKIADTGHWLYFCSDTGPMVQWNGTDEAIRVADGAAPVNVSSIVVLNQRVIANDLGTNRFWYTDPPDLTNPTMALTWSGYLEVGRTSEDVVGLGVAGGELIVFKRESLQAFYDDGTTPYRPITGSQQFYGLISASALTKYTNALFFVGPDRQIRQLLNREVTNIGYECMTSALDMLIDTSDVSTYVLDRWVIFNFLTDKKTFVYDPVLRSWTQFSTFSSGAELGFLGRCTTMMPAAGETNIWVIGANTGSIYIWDWAAYSDADNPIKFRVRTTHNDWGTGVHKQSTRLLVKVSTKGVKESQSPMKGFSLPAARRCVLYNTTTTLEQGVTADIAGLPTGFSYTQTGQSFTVFGSTATYAGDKNIVITMVDNAGRRYVENRIFTVLDKTGIEVGVL